MALVFGIVFFFFVEASRALRPDSRHRAVLVALQTFRSFVLPYIFNPDYGYAKPKIGLVFGAIMLVYVFLGYLCVPEIRMRSHEELDELYMNRLPIPQFKTSVTVAEKRAAEA